MYFIMSKFFRTNFLFGLIFLFAPFAGMAQVNDAGLWASVNVEKKFTNKISMHINLESRLNENFSELGTFYTELIGEYKYNKIFSVSGGYRFIQKRQVNDSYSTRHRYLVNLNIRHKLANFAANARIRFQSQYADINSSEDGQTPSNYLRPKLALKYDLQKKYTPFVSGELFFHLNSEEGFLFDNYRLSAGLEYEFSKKSTIEVGYLIDREIQIKNPLTSYVIVIGWNYVFK